MSLDEILGNAKSARQGELKYVSIPKTGDYFEGTFVKVEEVRGNFKGQPFDAVEFVFKVGENEKTWTRRLAAKPTISLLDQFKEKGVKAGDVVRITRTGEAITTGWDVQRVAKKEEKVNFDF